jgi:hypothetical protein
MSLAADVAASLGQADRLGVKDATLIRVTPGTRTPDAQSAGTNPTTTSHSCRAFVRSYDAKQVDGTLVKAEDRVISIFADTIDPAAVPQVNDKVTIDGETYRIVGGGKDGTGIASDPANVLYRCHGRR